jgi:hypothetical protein
VQSSPTSQITNVRLHRSAQALILPNSNGPSVYKYECVPPSFVRFSFSLHLSIITLLLRNTHSKITTTGTFSTPFFANHNRVDIMSCLCFMTILSSVSDRISGRIDKVKFKRRERKVYERRQTICRTDAASVSRIGKLILVLIYFPSLSLVFG